MTTAPTDHTGAETGGPTSSEPGATEAIRVRGLTRTYAGAHAVDGIDLSVEQGAFLVLLGPSGCGKTTTLRMLAGLESPSAGEIHLAGRRVASGETGLAVAPGRRGAGLVFQSYALWPHMTVRANVEWPLKVAKWDRRRRRERADEVMAMLAIDTLAARYPGEISGGQQQRVAIARTLGPEPSVLLFDEPLSNLDAKLRVETRGELLRIHRSTGATSVYVTHDQVEAMTMATHVALMKDGRIEQYGPPHELVARPATAFVATFIGTPPANVLPGRVQGGSVRLGEEVVAASALPDQDVQVMYRAESLRLDDAGPLVLDVLEKSPLAGRWVLSGLVRGTRTSVVVEQDPQARLGDRVRVGVPPVPDAVFDAAGARIETGRIEAGRVDVLDGEGRG